MDSIQIIKRIRILNMTSRKRRIESIVGEILLQKCFEKIDADFEYRSVKNIFCSNT